MASINKKKLKTDSRVDYDTRVAGGFGAFAAMQDAEGLLRRSVMACLLWEDNFYQGGESIADSITQLVPLVEPATAAETAREARQVQKLRHVPLLIGVEMARHKSHRPFVGTLLPQIITRADQLSEFLALYWRDGRVPLAKQVKIGLAQAFKNFDAYQLAKYKGLKKEIALRDVLRLVHPIPDDDAQSAMWKQLADDTLPTPDTWEVALSRGDDKRETWERLIINRKLGALAYLRNLRNMEAAGVDHDLIRTGLSRLNGRWLLPVNYVAAAKHAPRFEAELEALMFQSLSQLPKLAGYTIFVIDTSGSMSARVSGKSEFRRRDVAAAMAMLALELCDDVAIYATGGSWDTHGTALVPNRRGFGLRAAINEAATPLGGGGIFTRQCLEYIRKKEKRPVDRIIVFSDSQDCDRKNKIPNPFGTRNYIVDVSAHTRGINYEGIWDAEVSGWSEGFLKFIQSIEA